MDFLYDHHVYGNDSMEMFNSTLILVMMKEAPLLALS